MEKIKINAGSVVYEIMSAQKLPDQTLEIVFTDSVPRDFGDIEIYTASGIRYAVLPGYSKVVKEEGTTVWLATEDTETPEDVDRDTAKEEKSLEERVGNMEERMQNIEQQIYSSI